MPTEPIVLSRRALLRASAAVSAGIVAGPMLISALDSTAAFADSGSATTVKAFVDDYQTNLSTNLTAATNAAVRIEQGFAKLWQTGATWNTGTVLDATVLHSSMKYAAKITKKRTNDQAKRAFIYDRQNQSYAILQGLGPLADIYKAGALAVTSITSAPDGVPATTINDVIPAGAPAGAALGAGSTTSDLGAVVTLINTVRGNYSSGNPNKYAYQYPRPWRQTENSTVVDTGVLDAYGFPVYESDVKVAPQLLLQRSLSPVDDAGFPSGHTNAFFLAGLALAYAVPERFQELVATAYDLADTRIIAGMHSPVDVIGGRILATALAAAILADPANASIKAAARAQALAYFAAQTGTEDLYAYAHSSATDTYGDRDTNATIVENNFSYGLPRDQARVDVTVPKGAEVLLETRQPYLDADQRREVLRTTAFGTGYPLLDGPEQWGRLNLFAAADGYAAFDTNVTVALDAAQAGYAASDVWRNDIDGRGALIKKGTGVLTLTGDNDYRGGTTVAGGTLATASSTALGRGDVLISGGTLAVTGDLTVRGDLRIDSGSLTVTGKSTHSALVSVSRDVTLGSSSVLTIALPAQRPYSPFPVLSAGRITGKFGRVVVPAGFRAEVKYSRTTVTVQVIKL